MKYINHSIEGFIVWRGENLSHKEVADAVNERIGGHVVSAGFMMYFDDGPQCFGESISLEITSEPTDTEQLKKQWGIE